MFVPRSASAPGERLDPLARLRIILLRLPRRRGDARFGRRDGAGAVEHAEAGVVAPLLVVFKPDHLIALAGERRAEHMMGGGLDPQRVMAGLKILPFVEAGQLILAGRQLETELQP